MGKKPRSHWWTILGSLYVQALLAVALGLVFVLVGLSTKAATPLQKQINTLNLALKTVVFEPQRLTGEWSLGLAMKAYGEGKSGALTTEFKGVTSGKYQLSRNFDFIFRGGLSARVGRVQESYKRTTTGNKLFLNEALFRLHLSDRFHLDGGVIGLSDLPSDLLISGSLGFLGLRQRYHRSLDSNTKINIWGQQLVPSSSSFDMERMEKEPLPYLLTNTLELSSAVAKNLDIQSSVTWFQFGQLPSKVAFEVSVLGIQWTLQGLGQVNLDMLFAEYYWPER